jgi:hypothetical protein
MIWKLEPSWSARCGAVSATTGKALAKAALVTIASQLSDLIMCSLP